MTFYRDLVIENPRYLLVGTYLFLGDTNAWHFVLEGGPIGELPENWDQTKDDTQSLFLNKSDKNDLEPYPLALSEEGNAYYDPLINSWVFLRFYSHCSSFIIYLGNPEGYERGMEQRFDPTPELDNLIMRPELYGEPPAMEGLSAGYDSRRRKRGSGTKVGGAGAATKVATKSGSGKKNLKYVGYFFLFLRSV